MPRFGASSWVWTYPFNHDSDVAVVPRLAALGGDHFELGGEAATKDAERLRLLRDALSDHGMSASVCAIFSADRDLACPDAESRRAGLDHARTCIATAVAIGATLVVGAFCGAGGRDVVFDEREERFERGATALFEIGELAREAGVTVAVEALNRYENNLVNTTADLVLLTEQLDHPNVGIHLDLFHANIEEASVAGAIRRAGRRLVHCHAVDSSRGAPGSGHLHWGEVCSALREVGYDGALVIESFDPSNTAWAPATSSWRPLAPTQDDLVSRGIMFLRATWETSGLTAAAL